MAFNTYTEGINNASSIANKAIATESSLSSLAPLASPLPTLLKAFQLYISAAEAYSHLLQSDLVSRSDKPTVQRKWRLVLERAEKIKRRVEELGGRVSNPEVADDLEESAVCRRASTVNRVLVEAWRAPPPDREFVSKTTFRDPGQPELAEQQLELDPEWADLPKQAWEVSPSGHWEVRQGPGADCSVTAGLGACLAHNERWGTKLCQDSLYPQTVSGDPRRSENAKHVVKLLLNGTWRQVVIDALLPRAKGSHAPLHITARSASTSHDTGPAWLPLAVKGYFKALGGYSIPGSDPAPDVYAFTGWIPERLDLSYGFQREKVWARLLNAFREGSVIITLGSGKDAGAGLVPLHAYGVTDLKEEERITKDGVDHVQTLHIFDPGSPNSDSTLEQVTEGLHNVTLGEKPRRVPHSFTMTWDEVCSKFATLNLNWKPDLMPSTALRHWSWPKPVELDGDSSSEWFSLRTSPKFRVEATAPQGGSELWLLLSQHVQDKSIPLDDVALHVSRDYRQGQNKPAANTAIIPETSFTPYTNALHTLVKYPLREGENVINAIASRDRGIFQTGFTLRAFAATGVALKISRIGHTLPFKESVDLALTKRSAGGNPAFSSHHQNPQFRLTVDSAAGAVPGSKSKLHFLLSGTKDVPWNVKVIWGKGERVFELSPEMILASSGAYSFGLAYCEVDGVAAGTYTVIASAYERDQLGSFKLQVESSSPINIAPIPQEGAGMFNRRIIGRWDAATAGGRPSGHGYDRNPRIEVTVPVQASLQARLLLPEPAPIPINLTLFKRDSGSQTGEMVGTSGPYVERVCGVAISRIKVPAGVYVLVPSTYETGVRCEWSLDLWADAAFSVESVHP